LLLLNIISILKEYFLVKKLTKKRNIIIKMKKPLK